MAADHGVILHLLVGGVLEMDNLGRACDLVAMSDVVEHLENLANAEALLRCCTIGTFEEIIKEVGLGIVHRELCMICPEFYHRYGVPALRSALLGRIPVLREVTTMGAYYLLANGDEYHVNDVCSDDLKPGSRAVVSDR